MRWPFQYFLFIVTPCVLIAAAFAWCAMALAQTKAVLRIMANRMHHMEFMLLRIERAILPADALLEGKPVQGEEGAARPPSAHE